MINQVKNINLKLTKYDAIILGVWGVSASGFKTIAKIVYELQKKIRLPIIVVQHTSLDTDLIISKNIIENPKTSISSTMPISVIKNCKIDFIIDTYKFPKLSMEN